MAIVDSGRNMVRTRSKSMYVERQIQEQDTDAIAAAKIRERAR